MRVEGIARIPRRPPSEVEWEDLLVRMEVMPRALRFAIGETGNTSANGMRILTDLVAREVWVARCLEEAANVPPAGTARDPEREEDAIAAADLVERFIRCRTRNFAMVQRRGVEVWGWTMRPAGEREYSAYQLLTMLVRSDVATLEALRQAAPRKAPAC